MKTIAESWNTSVCQEKSEEIWSQRGGVGGILLTKTMSKLSNANMLRKVF